MPNYCENRVKFTAPDEEMASKLSLAIKSGKLFSEFIETPSDITDNGAILDWRVRNWGTKWEPIDLFDFDQEGLEFNLEFFTAWSPPIPFYDKLLELNFEVEAYYNEPGIGYCGQYHSGCEDTFKYDDISEGKVPNEIIEMFDLADTEIDEEDEG